MKTRNLRVNKKRLAAFILATSLLVSGGVVLTKNLIKGSRGEVTTQVEEVKEVEVKPYTYFYTTDDLTFVSNGELIGYLNNRDIDFSNIELLDYQAYYSDMYINTDNTDVYLLPGFDNESKHSFKIGDMVSVKAYSPSGWAIVYYYDNNNELKVGFVHCSYLSKTNPLVPEVTNTPEPIEEVKVLVAKITGDKVNVRSTMQTGTNNRIGYCNTGEKFRIIEQVGDWYLIDYYGKNGYVNRKFVSEEQVDESALQSTISSTEIVVAKITGNNVNVRSSTSTRNDSNIIGFCDISDKFEIIDHTDGWYHINYLGKDGYVSAKYVREITVDREEFNIQKMVALSKDAPFYYENGNIMCYLPVNQNLLVIDEVDKKYKVVVDGVVGYVNKSDTKRLTRRTVVLDLSRATVKAYHNGKELFRAHGISGAQGMETELGCFTIGHHLPNYTFDYNDIFNEVWIQFDHNRGFHPADANGGKPWQKEKYFKEVAESAYANWARGKGKLYPCAHGSHGCFNMRLVDVLVLYDLCDVGDNVLVIGQNDLIRSKILTASNDSYIVFGDDYGNNDFIWCTYANNDINNNLQKVKELV